MDGYKEIHVLYKNESWEYNCRDCGQLLLSLDSDKPTWCGNCGSTDLIVDRPGELPAPDKHRRSL